MLLKQQKGIVKIFPQLVGKLLHCLHQFVFIRFIDKFASLKNGIKFGSFLALERTICPCLSDPLKDQFLPFCYFYGV
jgi:hypothetical protein